MKKLLSLSVFFPAYNDAYMLPYLIAVADDTARRVAAKYELIVINDGSTDHTGTVLKLLRRRYPRLRTVTHPENRGYGAALRSGFAAARYDWVFYTDGDGQYDPSELASLVRAHTRNTDVVNGYKTRRSDPWYRTVIGSLYNTYIQKRHRPPIRDIDCDFRLIRRSLLANIRLTSTSGSICIELITQLRRAGATFREIPVRHYPRRFGTSRFFSLTHLTTTLHELVAINP